MSDLQAVVGDRDLWERAETSIIPAPHVHRAVLDFREDRGPRKRHAVHGFLAGLDPGGCQPRPAGTAAAAGHRREDFQRILAVLAVLAVLVVLEILEILEILDLLGWGGV